MRLMIVCLFGLACLCSCKKDKETIDQAAYWNCNKSMNLDTAAISTKLVGNWIWTKQHCFWTNETWAADKNIKVSFLTDHTFFVREGSNIITQGTWTIKVVDSSCWGVDLSIASEYLYGYMLFCGNEVLFNDSYRDGCDNLFSKTN